MPDPFGPINPTIEPCSTDIEISTLALTPPKDLLTFDTSNIAITLVPPALLSQLHLQLHQIFQDTFLLTIPLPLQENKQRLQ